MIEKINNHQKITAHLFWLFGGMSLGSMINFPINWLNTLSLIGLTIFFYAYSLEGDKFIKIINKNEVSK